MGCMKTGTRLHTALQATVPKPLFWKMPGTSQNCPKGKKIEATTKQFTKKSCETLYGDAQPHQQSKECYLKQGDTTLDNCIKRAKN